MIQLRNSASRAEREAADWYSRLLKTKVENEELEAFEAWRRTPENLAAYNRIDDLSRAIRTLREDPEIRAVAQAARNRPHPRRPPSLPLLSSARARWTSGLALAGLAAVAIIGWNLAAPTYQTAVGQQVEARLADGSLVSLNTNSAVKVRFADGQRRVTLLRGQAFFEVAHDPDHPFIVTAGDTEVRALGTRFDVWRRRDGVKVVLAEGKVTVSQPRAAGRAWTLAPGQTLTAGGQKSAPQPAPADVAAATAWTTGHLSFHGTPLADAVAEVNRYSRDKIVLGPGAPAGGRINGVFPVGKPDDFVTAISALYGLRSERRLDGRIELRSPPPFG